MAVLPSLGTRRVRVSVLLSALTGPSSRVPRQREPSSSAASSAGVPTTATAPAASSSPGSA